MRCETTFLPPRISTTSSMGISTRPILSWSVNASTRLSRLSFTFFSKPEYVWMMYHCIAIGLYDLSNSKNFKYVRDPALHEPINNREKNAEERDGRDHHRGGRDDFFATRPGDCLHLQADVVQKLTRFLNGAGDLTADLARASADSALRIVVFHFYRLRSHRSSQPNRLAPAPGSNSGRGGGIRTPIPGFGDRSPNRWTTPLYPEPAPSGRRVNSASCPPCSRSHFRASSNFLSRLQPFTSFSRDLAALASEQRSIQTN